MAISARLRDLMKKYGKVALGVHFSVSGASIAGLYAAIKSNADVESLFEKVGLSSSSIPRHHSPSAGDPDPDPDRDRDPAALLMEEEEEEEEQLRRRGNRTAELAASSGGALALAILCNKALFPIRVPITIALTPPIARFLAKRKLVTKV